MKIIVIGLGNFGSILSIRLTDMGHEVIGVDSVMENVNAMKTRLSTSIALDAGKIEALAALPIKDVDLIIVAIGTDFASSVQAVAALKQAGARRIIARGLSTLHIGVLQTLGVERVIFVEKDSAELLAQSLSLGEFISSYRIDAEHYVMQFTAPSSIVGSTVAQTKIEDGFKLRVITIKRMKQTTNILGLVHSERAVTEIAASDTVIESGDIIVVYGKLRDYDAFTRSLRAD